MKMTDLKILLKDISDFGDLFVELNYEFSSYGLIAKKTFFERINWVNLVVLSL